MECLIAYENYGYNKSITPVTWAHEKTLVGTHPYMPWAAPVGLILTWILVDLQYLPIYQFITIRNILEKTLVTLAAHIFFSIIVASSLSEQHKVLHKSWWISHKQH